MSRYPLTVFQNAYRTVPAYRDFLSRQHVRVSNPHTLHDFFQLPCVDKKNYIHAYSLMERCPRGILSEVIYASSGSSGIPTYWFSSDAEVQKAGAIHEELLHDHWHIKKRERTLVVVCFSMGVWIAGQHTRQAFLETARRGYCVTVISPGYAKADIIAILAHLTPSYHNVILAGHPPFIMDVVQEARRRNISFPRKKTFFLTAGDKTDEVWRDTLVTLIGGGDPLRTVVNVYGSTDAGIMAYETPVSVSIRRQAMENKSLRKALFGDATILPALFQYHPEFVYFEELQGELVLTANTPTPLVRYNIHDHGKVIPYHDMMSLLRKEGVDGQVKKAAHISKLPFVAVIGRADVAATFYALHVYPEHINAGLAERGSARLTTGNYISYVRSVQKGRSQEFHIELELARGVKTAKRVEEVLRANIVKQLIRLNIEYRKLHEWIGIRALPKLHLHPHHHQSFIGKKVKGFIRIVGKKPKMVS